MRKPVHIALAVLLAVLVSGVVWQVLRLREPVYQGKRLTLWLDNDNGSPAAEQSAQQAVQKAGTNAIPTLLWMLRQRDSPLKRQVMELAQRQRFVKVHYIPSYSRNEEAWVGFSTLGASAAGAVPALMEICDRNISWSSQIGAVRSLAAIGAASKRAIPVLLRATTNSHFLVRAESLHVLVRVQAEPELVVPALTNALSDPNSTVRFVACVSLAELGGGAKQAVPALVRTLGDPVRDVQYHAAAALKSIPKANACKLNRLGREDFLLGGAILIGGSR